MDKLVIEGGPILKGKVEVPASKNAALPLMCLSLLTDKEVSFSNHLPQVADIRSMVNLLKHLGVQEEIPGSFYCPKIRSIQAPYELVRKMRASILVLGPLLARTGEATVSLPGGCAIGERPVDIHLKGLQALGAKIDLEEGYIKARCQRLRGTRFVLDYPTVTGTINLLTAAVLAEGETILENIAREPEVVEVIQALNQMGARIEGEGSSCLKIQGVNALSSLRWTIQPDRIQFLTYLAAGAITGGAVECFPYRPGTLNTVLQKFKEMGCELQEKNNSVSLKSTLPFQPIDLETAPFPGFPTDGQAQFMACLTRTDPQKGQSKVRETVFEKRFGHVSELRRLGAQIKVRGNIATLLGVPELKGASVMASDLRASASLVLAGLAAHGQTEVLRIYHLDRGYEHLESKLVPLGAKVQRVHV